MKTEEKEKKKSLLKKLIEGYKAYKIQPRVEPNYKEFYEVEHITGHLDSFEKFIYNSDSTVGIILGARGNGKTGLGVKMLENVAANSKKKLFGMGFQRGSLPKWVKIIDDINEIENNSFVVIDESGIRLSSRNSMSNINKMFSEMLFIARHKNISILLISQNSSNIEINAIRQADYLMLKPSSLLQRDFERKKITEIYEDVNDKFEKHKDYRGLTYIYSDKYVGFINNDLSRFWSSNISKSHRGK